MKFVCLGYIDESKWADKAEGDVQAAIDACLAYDDQLRDSGHFLGGEALDSIKNCVTLRSRGEKVDVTDGPFVESKEQIGGILLLEARDLNHAIQLMSKHPGLQIGPFEIRAADESFNEMVAQRRKALSK